MKRYTVRSLMAELNRVVNSRYPGIEVEGEISQINRPASGHAYIKLRDGDALLNGVVWRSTWQGLRYQPTPGERVICRGRLSVYDRQGSCQIEVRHIEPAGAGKLAAEIARRLARLRADGLLDPARKKPLPRVPRYVGVATSPTGAAVQDFLKVSRERFPAARILVSPCTVQGENAAGSVVAAMDLLLQDGRSEVIVVTRGGGAKTDLLAFQDEFLARFIAKCPVPVVSAVGHQIDTTLADLVADAVAPTPSAAAMTVLPDGRAWARAVDEAAMSLQASMLRSLQRRRQRVTHARQRLRHPGERLVLVRRRLELARGRLTSLTRAQIQRGRQRLTPVRPRLEAALLRRLPRHRQDVERLELRLQRAMSQLLAERRRRVVDAARRSEALSPVQVLQRGYAIVTGPDGVVMSTEAVEPGDTIEVRVQDGVVRATVE